MFSALYQPKNNGRFQKMDVTIHSINHKGEGVAKHDDGQSIMVPYTLEGEVVSIDIISQNKFGYKAKVLDILQTSKHRQEPPCPHFKTCGGCALQHMDNTSYQQFKKQLITDALRQKDLTDTIVNDVTMLPEKVRRRCKFIAQKTKHKASLGFRQKNSHDIAHIKTCHVIHPKLEALIKPLEKVCHLLLNNKQQAEIYLSVTENLVDIYIDLGKVEKFLTYEEREDLAYFATRKNIAKLTLKTKDLEDLLYLKEEPFVKFGDVPIHVGSKNFLQASEQADTTLQSFILDYFKDKKIQKVADLFCGRGTFSFIFDNAIKVHGYEADKTALSALNKAALRYKPSVQGHILNLYDEPLQAEKLNKYDAVVLDPPRDGAYKQCLEITKSKVQNIAYVSCNPQTFARDSKVLTDAGYTLKTVKPIDQFLWSSHIEMIGFFEK